MMWRERIPAAIEKAEALYNGVPCKGMTTNPGVVRGPGYVQINRVTITATELVLAKALWKMFIDECADDIERGGLGMNIEDHQVAFPVLKSFTEKIESKALTAS